VTENQWTHPQPSSTPAPDVSRPKPRKIAMAAALTAVGVAGGVLVGVGTSSGTTLSGSASPAPSMTPGRGDGSWSFGPDSSAGSLGGSTSGSSTAAAATATADQQIGLVNIDTVLGYQNGEAAGTGMVLSSDGEILTNNHVVDGATSISVTIVSTGASYTATVFGTDPTDDVAVLQLQDASGLQVADFSDTTADLGTAVTAVGNAGGTGIPSAADGTVTAVEQTITAGDESGGSSETLHGLIETDADVQAGDSGGPLYDTASGQIVGMDTAASTGANVVGYAIPISDALSIAEQITQGVDTATVHQGYPAFLGVSVLPHATGGASIAGVLPGGQAEQAGLAAGDVITRVDGSAINSSDDLTTALAAHEPGDTVRVVWADATGRAHAAQVPLAAGPAD
jgi:S1-C subfamily serine protease